MGSVLPHFWHFSGTFPMKVAVVIRGGRRSNCQGISVILPQPEQVARTMRVALRLCLGDGPGLPVRLGFHSGIMARGRPGNKVGARGYVGAGRTGFPAHGSRDPPGWPIQQRTPCERVGDLWWDFRSTWGTFVLFPSPHPLRHQGHGHISLSS